MHSFQDHGLANGHALISEAWCKLRLLLRWPVLSDAPFPLSAPFAQTFSSCREKYDALVAREFQEAAPKCNVIVIDGNQKLTRRCCAERFANVVSLPGAHLSFLQDCSHAPKRQMPFQRDAGVHVKKKACLARDPQELLTCTPSTACASWPLQGWLRNQVPIHSKRSIEKPGSDMDCLEARDYVSCNTVKMRRRSCRRTGGWLLACAGDGVILHAMEFLGGESLTQRAALVAELKQRYPALDTINHDDSCHLRRFVDRWCAQAYPDICNPRIQYIIDKFHSKAHTDQRCRQHCAPSVAENQKRMEGRNSSACELFFAWFSRYKTCFRYMGEHTGHSFVHEVLLAKNAWMREQAARQRQ